MPYRHGLRYAPEYYVWQNMKRRCTEKTNHKYPIYGARGISVCERWMNSPATFIADMGPRPTTKHQLDRIDNNGNYEPSNCRWATPKEQANNRNYAKAMTLDGHTLSLRQWAAWFGVSAPFVRYRLRLGWSLHKALTTPSLRPRNNPTKQEISHGV